MQWNNGFVPLFLNISHKTYFCSSGDRAFRLLLLRTVFTSWSIGSMMGHNRSPGYLQTHLSLRCRIFNISEILPARQPCISLYHVADTIQYKITWTNVKTQTRKHFKTLRTQPLISPKRLWEKACHKGSLVLAELCICCVFVFVLFLCYLYFLCKANDSSVCSSVLCLSSFSAPKPHKSQRKDPTYGFPVQNMFLKFWLFSRPKYNTVYQL